MTSATFRFRPSAGALVPSALRLAAIAVALCVSTMPLDADEQRSLALSAGIFRLGKDDDQGEGGLGFRFPTKIWKLVADTGFTYTEEGSYFVWGGLRRDIPLGDRWQITPGFGVALYEEGDGKDLGGPVQFRSLVELSHQWPKGNRLALAFYHLSNGGLEDPNPGSNSLVLVYSIPF